MAELKCEAARGTMSELVETALHLCEAKLINKINTRRLRPPSTTTAAAADPGPARTTVALIGSASSPVKQVSIATTDDADGAAANAAFCFDQDLSRFASPTRCCAWL
jgi:hypothetical protein